MKDIVLLYQLLKMMKTFKKIEDSSMQQMASHYKLTGPQMELLWLCYFSNGSTITEITNLGLWHISTTMHLTKELEKNKYLEKRRLISDKRTSQVFITEKGSEVVEKMILSIHPENDPIIRAAVKTSEELNMDINDFLKFGLHLCKHLYGESHQMWIDQNANKLDEVYDSLKKTRLSR